MAIGTGLCEKHVHAEPGFRHSENLICSASIPCDNWGDVVRAFGRLRRLNPHGQS